VLGQAYSWRFTCPQAAWARQKPTPSQGRLLDAPNDLQWRGYRVGSAVTGGVQPMPPGAGLAIRLQTGPGRRRSSACAAARPGPPPGHSSRC